MVRDTTPAATGAGAGVAPRAAGDSITGGLRSAPAIVACVAAAAWMLLLYRPWESAPFSIIDFSEFLPLLTGHATFGDRLRALVSYYASQGRFNPLPYAALALKWSAFGNNPVAWQWIRAGQMFAIFVATLAVLRELGFRWLATLCGAALLITAASVVSAWTRLTMAEPMAVCFLLGATLFALRYQRTARWRAGAAAIGVLLLCALLSKEMLVFAVPFLLLVAWLYRGDGEWSSFPERSRRNLVLLFWVSGVVAVVGVSTVLTLLHSRAGSFGSNYGASGVSLFRAIRALGYFALPFSNGAMAGPENLLYAAVVCAGLYASWKRGRLRLAPWLAAASLPFVAALLYAPWPGLQDFYVLPGLVGNAILLALAVEALAEAGRPATVLAFLTCAAMLASSSRNAYSRARVEVAARRVDGEVARLLARVPPGYTTLLAIRPELINRTPAQQWMMHGPTLSRYAAAVSGHPVPLAIEVTCGEAEALLQASRPVVIAFNGGCAFGRPSTIGVRAGFDFWVGFRHQQAAMGADVVWPFALPGAATRGS